MGAVESFQDELLKVSASVRDLRMPFLSKAIIKVLRVVFLKRRKKDVAEAVTQAVTASVEKKRKRKR